MEQNSPRSKFKKHDPAAYYQERLILIIALQGLQYHLVGILRRRFLFRQLQVLGGA